MHCTCCSRLTLLACFRDCLNNSKPTLIAIDNDDYHAEHCGVTKEGKQFVPHSMPTFDYLQKNKLNISTADSRG